MVPGRKRFALRTWRRGVPALIAIFVVMYGAGMAAAALVVLKGSDTLLDPIRRAIVLSGATIDYQGGGSGTGETALVNHTQGIAPMSRNFTSAILTAHPTWAPAPENVL